MRATVGAVVIMAAIMTAAVAHGPYDFYCCQNEHCRLALPGEVMMNDRGYLVSTPGFEPEQMQWQDSRIRRGPEDHYHVCRLPQQTLVRCLYIPFAGG